MNSESETLHWLSSLLQSTDPLYPIGSYAHSYGLEEIVALGIVIDERSLETYLLETLAPTLENLELPFLRFLYSSFGDDNTDQAVHLDQRFHASMPSEELRQAHVSQGRQRLRLLRNLKENPLFDELDTLRKEKKILPTHLTIYSAEKYLSRTPLEAALISWTYQSFAAAAAASLKLIRIGQEGAQRALTTALKELPAIVENSLAIEAEDAGCFNPIVDIASSRHQKAYSRLFIS